MTAADIERLQRRAREQDDSLRAVSDTVIDIKDTVDQHSGQLTAVQRTLAEHSRRLESLRSGQEALIAAQGRTDDRFGRLEAGQESLIAAQGRTDDRLGRLEAGQESLVSGQESLVSGQESLRSEMTTVREMLGELLRRSDPR